ncbi:MAG TPA: cell division protein FtsL [Usitatibacter sp.]|jgi:cell division protein FtsL|nr:cell division protein FtsL [Usitatibacter sp.]
MNALLLLAVIACALAVVTAQHRSRKLFAELDTEQAAAKKLDEEWTQLQLEQGTWATHKRIEAVASHQLGMHFADPASTVIIDRAGVPAATPAGAR